MVKTSGAESLIIAADKENNFKVSVDDLASRIKAQPIKLLIINSPANPTGVVYRRDEL
jgi:aspartate aminotransferase